MTRSSTITTKRRWAAAGLAAAALVATPAGIVFATRGDGTASPNTSASRPVMPGHGLVMPTDVAAVGGPRQLVVAVGDYWFKPSVRRLRAGRYGLVARNYGVTAHDVMVERTPIEFSEPGQPVDEAAPYGVEALTPGTRGSTSVVLGPGRWEVFCSVGGHYQSGQHFTLDVYGRLPSGMHERTHGMEEDEGPDEGGSMM